MTVRELLAQLQHLPRELEVLAFEAGCQDYCEREVDELELQGGHVYLPWGPAATSRRAVSRLGPWPSSTPAKRQPLRRMRAAFGFIEVLEVVHHDDG